MKGRILKGTVVSMNMQKTAVVEVSTSKVHPKYGRRYRTTKKYKVHFEDNELNLGDEVTIVESKPISKTKSWVIQKESK